MSRPAALRAFRRPRLWLGTWYFGWVLCVVLSLVRPPDLGLSMPEGDKFGHVLAYALLAAWAVWIYAAPRAHRRAAIALFLLGIAMEIAQGALTDYRMMDPWDAVADGMGILGGWWLAARRPALLQRLEGLAAPAR